MKKFLIIVAILLTACSGEAAETTAPDAMPASTTAAPTVIVQPRETAITASNTPEATAAIVETATSAATDIPGLESVPPFSSIDADWKRLYPTDPTVCAHDTEYSFWARQGTSDNLLIYFAGGGGCWSAETCALRSQTYVASVGREITDFQVGQGIFDLDNPDNPFKDYDMVFIPVCTGDLHLGNYTRTYTDANGAEVTIEHKGFINASTVLNWVYAGVPNPSSIFVTGCSAGSTGAVAHTPYIIEHYPDVSIAQLGDSLGYVFQTFLDAETKQNTMINLAQWIPEFASMTPDGLTLAQIYTAEANYYPHVRFAQMNYQADEVQKFFYQILGGDPLNWYADTRASLDRIHAAAPNFYSYTGAGTEHCILPLNGFYTLETGGVRFRDWVANYATGADVASRVECEECAVENP